MKVTKNTVVSLTYEMRLENNEGELIENVKESNPFIFLFTQGALLPEFEKHVSGLEVGDKFDFTVTPEQAYGAYDEDSVVSLPKDMFYVNGKFDEEGVKIGEWIPLRTEEGDPLEAEVVAIGEDTVSVDFNHELAGETLHFNGEVLGVRMASKQEVEQGYSVEEEEE